jgi:hypothetical protein
VIAPAGQWPEPLMVVVRPSERLPYMSNELRFDPFDVTPAAAGPGPVEGPGLTPSLERFYACRWHKLADAGVAAHCTHRDVLPIAGTAGFSADAWCTDCDCFKVRRLPRRSAYA